MFSWPIVFLIIVVLCVITVEGFSLVTKNLDRMDRTNDNQLGRASAFISSAFIFICAFTIVTSWTEDSKVHSAAEHEVVAAQNLLREAALLAPADTSIRVAMTDYAQIVLHEESGETGELVVSAKAEDAFIKVENAAIAVTEQPGADKYRAQEVLDSLNEFKLGRQERVGELGNTVALPLILLLVVTGFLNLAAIGMFPGGTSHWVKQTFGVIVAVAVAAMLTSVVVLESAPFIHEGLAAPLQSFISELNSH